MAWNESTVPWSLVAVDCDAAPVQQRGVAWDWDSCLCSSNGATWFRPSTNRSLCLTSPPGKVGQPLLLAPCADENGIHPCCPKAPVTGQQQWLFNTHDFPAAVQLWPGSATPATCVTLPPFG